jgi:ABC-type transport system involved in multi-copper enzyme maturation permease subunit
MLTIRGTVTALALFVVLSVAVAGLDGWSARTAIDSHNPLLRPDFSAAQAGFDGIGLSQLAVIVFGVLLVSSEYGAGTQRVSLLAIPRRGVFFAAKVTVAASTTILVAVPVTVLAYVVTQLALGTHGVSLHAHGVPRAMVGTVGYLALMCLFAAGLAMLARGAVLPLVVLLPLVLTGSQILSAIGATAWLARYLPDRAGSRLMAVSAAPGELGAWQGGAVLVTWTVVALAAGLLALCRRDA